MANIIALRKLTLLLIFWAATTYAQETLSVSISPRAGVAPLEVVFEVLNAEAYTFSYLWSYGTGVTGEGALNEYTYEEAGNYLATLVITDELGEAGRSTFDLSVIPSGFDVVPVYDPATGMTTWDLGIEPPTICIDFVWDFGDGTRGRGTYVQHEYQDLGMYEAKLSVINRCED